MQTGHTTVPTGRVTTVVEAADADEPNLSALFFMTSAA